MKNIYRILLFICVFLILCTFYLIYPIYRAINVSDRMMGNTVSFEQHPPNPDKSILVAGDSIAVGIGAKNPRESIAGRLGHQFPNVDITNLGLNGAKLQDLLQILRNHNNKHYDLIVLQIGANDITHFTSYSTIKSELSEILSLSNKLSSKVIILTSGNIGNAPVFHWPLSTIITGRTLNVRQIFMEEAAKNKAVTYIDLFKNRKDDPLAKNINKYYAPDFFHLSGDGYGIWYLQIQKVL